MRNSAALAAILCLTACAPAPPRKPLTVAAAANLTQTFETLGPAFTKATGIPVVFSFGSTAQLSKQIENGAPFDAFAAADTEHVDSLLAAHKLVPGTRAIYALGQLALWTPKQQLHSLADLDTPAIKFIAIAQPELAPYGQAAVEVLKSAKLWEKLQGKIVYAGNISQARQLAVSGNADAAFTAYSLVFDQPPGSILKPSHRPIEQAFAQVTATAEAGRFHDFLLGPAGRAILERFGYRLP